MPESSSIRVKYNVPVPMRDGGVLYADVYAPASLRPFPVLLQCTPYDKTTPLTMGMFDPLKAARRGIAVVNQDTRGRQTPQGEFYAFLDDIDDGLRYHGVGRASTVVVGQGRDVRLLLRWGYSVAGGDGHTIRSQVSPVAFDDLCRDQRGL